MESKEKIKPYLIFILALLLSIYPLRHIALGVDIWDTGYNYANFQYNGLEYMDSMWFFATWLANGVGSILTAFPYGNTVIGMNVYTALFVSVMAVGTFLFCVHICKMPIWLAFSGELLACALCWAPTAMLYSYLTYLFLLAACICLYQGLLTGRRGYLLGAGIILGLNVGVRFSNLAQIGLILVVWGYALLVKTKWEQVLKDTGVCVLGYVLGFGALLLLISLRYGFFTYWESVLRLFQMTEVATDYSPLSMLLGMFGAYFDCSYWLKRYGLMLVVCTLLCMVVPEKLQILKKILTVAGTCVLFYWLSQNYFYVRDYAFYQSIYYPCVALFALALVVCVLFLVKKEIPARDKLKSLFVMALILIGTLGSNNAMYSSINNSFLVMPFLLYMIWKLCREEKMQAFFPLKCVMVLTVVIVSVQALGFGHTFSYEEATGGRNMDTEITGIPVLEGMVTSAEKAESLKGLYQYLEENSLRDRECILYGQIPAIAHYMELPPAMNTWSDLRSYSAEVMSRDLEKIRLQMSEGKELPLIIMEASWAKYREGLSQDAVFLDETTSQKLQLITAFMNEFQYCESYANEKYVVYVGRN